MEMVSEDTGDEGELFRLLNDMLDLRESIVLRANRHLQDYANDAGTCKSACNLAHYLVLREEDRRPLQERLARYGLSSLGRGESHVLGTIDAIIRVLMSATGQTMVMMMSEACHAPAFDEGNELLEHNTAALFGAANNGRATRIMVTLPAEAARDPGLIRDLLLRGTDCVRINCAHDDRNTWAGMVANVRRVSDETGRTCRILMDVAGHKLRTGPIEPGPAVLRLKVKRDPFGRIIEPARLLLIPLGSPFSFAAEEGVLQLPLPPAWLSLIGKKARLEFTDSRDKQRSIEIVGKADNDAWHGLCHQSAYISTATRFTLHRHGEAPRELGTLGLESLPSKPQPILVHKGESLLLSDTRVPGAPARLASDGSTVLPARIGCTLPEVLKQAQPGDPVWIDDGKVGAAVERQVEEGLLLRVTHTSPKGARIREDKGLNFPETRLQLPPLSTRDCADLDFICSHADMVGFSFVESFEDMQQLMAELDKRGAGNMPIIAKIETRNAVINLPEILLGTIGQHRLGIMIARGDLAVELGSVRMAEIQEEILWLCEAAHVPVIWATQVFESIAKKGVRSRPEFTDAAMGVRAECVMLNKGPYINNAVEALDRVLSKMQDHQHKKISRMRALHLHW
jgi:pyruvate kinase